MESQKKEKKLNPGGRPNLADEEVLDYRLVTRVNGIDKQAFEQDFKAWNSGRGDNRADYLREIVLNRNNVKSGSSREIDKQQLIEITQTLHGIRQQMRHIDTNYNQIARRINSIEHMGKLYYEVQSSKAIIERLLPLINQIDEILKEKTETFFAT